LGHCPKGFTKLYKESGGTTTAIPRPMYDSLTDDQKQALLDEFQHQTRSNRDYRHCQANPNTFATQFVPLWCNGNRCKFKDWRDSREAHRNMGFKWSRATEHRLKELSDDHAVMAGSLHLAPDATIDDWRTAKSKFRDKLGKWCKRNGWTVEFMAKLHVSIRYNPDRIHYDLVLYHTVSRSEKWVRMEILELWRQSGGLRGSLTLLDTYPGGATDYLFKFASEFGPHYQQYMRTFPMPSTKLPITWFSKGFWGRTKTTVQRKCYMDGVYQEMSAELSPMEQHWHEWTVEISDDLPRFETFEYRERVRIEEEMDAILNDPMHVPVPLEYRDKTRNQPELEDTQLTLVSPTQTEVNSVSENGQLVNTKEQSMHSDEYLDKHYTSGGEDYWIQQVHLQGRKTGKYRIAIADDRQRMPSKFLSVKGRSEFSQPEIETILDSQGWKHPSWLHPVPKAVPTQREANGETTGE
jgi:hypothetical protein